MRSGDRLDGRGQGRFWGSDDVVGEPLDRGGQHAGVGGGEATEGKQRGSRRGGFGWLKPEPPRWLGYPWPGRAS
jgi:hypothetical protein